MIKIYSRTFLFGALGLLTLQAHSTQTFPNVCQYAQSGDQNPQSCGGAERELHREYPSYSEEQLQSMGRQVADIFATEYARRARQGELERVASAGPNYDGRLHRGTHSKSHGCALTNIKVAENIPQEFRVGPFAESGREYNAWTRWANGTSFVKPDKDPDARSMSIKLTGVPGAKLFRGAEDSQNFDFVMNDAPVFFIKSPGDFVTFFDGVFNSYLPQKLFFARFFILGGRWDEKTAAERLGATNTRNLLTAKYYSGTAIRWGQKAVKYIATPKACEGVTRTYNPEEIWQTGSRDALRHVLDAQLQLEKIPACWDLQIQVQTNPWTMPIEDATIEWPEAGAEIHTVAHIKIEPQPISVPAKMEFCDGLQFSTWRVTEEFKPLGDLSRLRHWAYYYSSQQRYQTNHQNGHYAHPPTEPTGQERF